jgi:hypothetical protein
VLPKRVNAVSAEITTDDRFILTIGTSDGPTVQYVFADNQLKMLVEEAARVYTVLANEQPFAG